MLVTIRRKRLEKGLTTGVAAERVGVSTQVLGQVETGRLRPWPALRAKLAALYGVPEAELFADLDEAHQHLRRLAGEEKRS